MGKKRYIVVLICILLSARPEGFVMASEGNSGIDGIRMESVTAMAPGYNIYFYADGGGDLASQKQAFRISYGTQALAVEDIAPSGELDDGVSYYLLIDVSGSISREYFEQVKAGISLFAGQMGKNDDMTLLTFGNEVRVIFQKETDRAKIEEQILPLVNTDENTLLFEALQKTARLADSREDAGRRKIALVVTDGEDFSENSVTESESKAALQEKGIPLYAMTARKIYGGRENPYIDPMGEFVRSTGGIMELSDEQTAANVMEEFPGLFAQAVKIQAKAATNRVDYTTKPLTVTFPDGTVETTDVKAVYYEEDGEAPKAEVFREAPKELKISFSEPVLGAEDVNHYIVRREGADDIPVNTVHVSEDKTKAVLTFAGELQNGAYEISFSDITDDSMEENKAEGTCRIEISDGTDGEEEQGVSNEIGLYLILAASILVLAAVLLIAWIVMKKRGGLVTIEGKAVLSSNVSKKHHVAIQNKPGKLRQISLQFEGKGEPLTAKIDKSLIVGRSDVCDIYLDDEKMSRQHFVLYDREDGIYIEDLHTKNGTYINGMPLQSQMKLKQGDCIWAGEVKMWIRW